MVFGKFGKASATSLVTTPPEQFDELQHHWLYSERASYPCIAEWHPIPGVFENNTQVKGWVCGNETGFVRAAEMYRRGWLWYAPAHPPILAHPLALDPGFPEIDHYDSQRVDWIVTYSPFDIRSVTEGDFEVPPGSFSFSGAGPFDLTSFGDSFLKLLRQQKPELTKANFGATRTRLTQWLYDGDCHSFVITLHIGNIGKPYERVIGTVKRSQ